MIPVRIVETGLRGITLRPLTRPSVGPSDEPTEELVLWAITMYAYSSIAHVRTVLAGLIALADLGNTPAGNIVSRHIFEWTAHACYMAHALKGFIANSQWKLAFDLTLQADTGNLWVRNYAHVYDTSPSPVEVLKPLRINKLISAYAKYQTTEYRNTTAEDSYGYLSERAHPNGFCFLQYREIVGPDVHFVEPPVNSTFGGVQGFLLEWLMFVHELLGLANESAVRNEVRDTLTAAVKPS
jgi:hypothetical protein